MKTIDQIRRDNLLQLRGGYEGPDNKYAEDFLDISPSFFGQLKTGKREIGKATAREFEEKHGKPVGWLDQSIHLTEIEREFFGLLRSLGEEQIRQLSAYGGDILASKQ